MTARRLRIDPVASRLHRSGPGAALLRLLRHLEQAITHDLRTEIHAVGQTHDAMIADGLLRDYANLTTRLPTRGDGGLIHLVAGVVRDDPAQRFDTILYLLERRARIASDGTMCASDATSARRWIAGCALRSARRE